MKLIALKALVLSLTLTSLESQASLDQELSCRRADFGLTSVTFQPLEGEVVVKIQSQFTGLLSGVKLPDNVEENSFLARDLVQTEFTFTKGQCKYQGTLNDPLVRCSAYSPDRSLKVRTRLVRQGALVPVGRDVVTRANHVEVSIRRVRSEYIDSAGTTQSTSYSQVTVTGYGESNDISNAPSDAMELPYRCR